MLGLRQQVGRDPPGVVVPVGDHEDLGGAGDEVDADLAEHAALGGGDIGVAGPGDLVDRLDRCGAVRQGRHRLSAADAPDLVGAGDPCREHDQGVERAAGSGHHHDDAANACDLGRHDVHQNRGRVRRRSARHVDPGRIHRPVARAQPRTRGVGEVDILRHQLTVEDLDTPGRKGQRLALRRRNLRRRRVAFGFGDAHVGRRDAGPVEFGGVVDDGRVAARAHVGHDAGDDAVDVLVGIAVAPEEGRKFLFEARRRSVQPKRHGKPRGQRRGNGRSSGRPAAAAS